MHYGFRLSDGSQLYNGLHIRFGFAPYLWTSLHIWLAVTTWISHLYWLRTSLVGFIHYLARKHLMGIVFYMAFATFLWASLLEWLRKRYLGLMLTMARIPYVVFIRNMASQYPSGLHKCFGSQIFPGLPMYYGSRM